jgi:hypothetical protein
MRVKRFFGIGIEMVVVEGQWPASVAVKVDSRGSRNSQRIVKFLQLIFMKCLKIINKSKIVMIISMM